MDTFYKHIIVQIRGSKLCHFLTTRVPTCLQKKENETHNVTTNKLIIMDIRKIEMKITSNFFILK